MKKKLMLVELQVWLVLEMHFLLESMMLEYLQEEQVLLEV